MISLALTLLCLVAPGQSDTLAIQARKVHMGDGRTLDRGVLIVEQGRIRAVSGGTELPSSVRVVQHDGVITPGFVAAHDQSSLGAEASDRTRPMLPELRVADAFDPKAKDLALAARWGVTTVLLAPGVDNLVGGQTAAVKTHGGRVLAREAHLAISLSSAALRTDTPPTSPMGAVALLESQFAANAPVFAEVRAGRLPVMIYAPARHELLRSVEFATRNKLRGAVAGASLAGEVLEPLKLSGLAVVFQPFSGGDEVREIRSVVATAAAGIPFAFALDSAPAGPAALRLSAAMCLREGADRKALERALFSGAADICGVGDHVGLLAGGYDADFLLWSGDPLDLTSRLEAVYIDGVRVETKKP